MLAWYEHAAGSDWFCQATNSALAGNPPLPAPETCPLREGDIVITARTPEEAACPTP